MTVLQGVIISTTKGKSCRGLQLQSYQQTQEYLNPGFGGEGMQVSSLNRWEAQQEFLPGLEGRFVLLSVGLSSTSGCPGQI